jgi:hypothetical protein
MIIIFLSNGRLSPPRLSIEPSLCAKGGRGPGSAQQHGTEPDGSASIIGDPEARAEAHDAFTYFWVLNTSNRYHRGPQLVAYRHGSVDVSVRSPKPVPYFGAFRKEKGWVLDLGSRVLPLLFDANDNAPPLIAEPNQ